MVFKNIILLLGCCCYFGTPNASAIPPRNDGYVYSEELKSYYKFHRNQETWSDARDTCRAENATLIVLRNEKEAEFYKKLINGGYYYFEKAYVGLHAMSYINDFRTENGVPLTAAFDTWNAGEPNAWNGREENCISMWHNGKLNDERCDVRLPFMCRKTKTEDNLNKPCNVPYEDYFYNEEIGKCYKLHSKKLSWSDAYHICKSEESHLAIVNDVMEATYYAKLLSPADPIVHLGIHNLTGSGFETIYGGKLTYNVWRNDDNYEFNNLFDWEESSFECGVMKADGLLIGVDCETKKAMYICEHGAYIAPSKNIKDTDDTIAPTENIKYAEDPEDSEDASLNIHADIKLTMGDDTVAPAENINAADTIPPTENSQDSDPSLNIHADIKLTMGDDTDSPVKNIKNVDEYVALNENIKYAYKTITPKFRLRF